MKVVLGCLAHCSWKTLQTVVKMSVNAKNKEFHTSGRHMFTCSDWLETNKRDLH
jgi:hypothetical protein